MTNPPQPPSFVLPIELLAAERHGAVDLYPPRAADPRPAVVFVHGGPIPADLRPTPRDWPVYRGYGSTIADRGAVGVTVDHRLHDPADFPGAAADVVAAVEFARADPRVDGDRVALWFFLTRVGHERPQFAATVETFVAAAGASGARMEIIDVPNGQHGFDMLDHTDESRVAVERAVDAVLTALN